MSASAAASDDESSAADAFETSVRARRRRQPDESSISAGRGESARGTHPGGPGSEATRVRRDALKKTLDPIVYSGPSPA